MSLDDYLLFRFVDYIFLLFLDLSHVQYIVLDLYHLYRDNYLDLLIIHSLIDIVVVMEVGIVVFDIIVLIIVDNLYLYLENILFVDSFPYLACILFEEVGNLVDFYYQILNFDSDFENCY